MKPQQTHPRKKSSSKIVSILGVTTLMLVTLLFTQSCDKILEDKACIDVRRESTVLTIAVNGEGNRVECIANDGQGYVINGGDPENCPATIRFQGTAQITIVDAVNNITLDTIIESNGRQGILYSTMETNAERCSCAN